MASLLNDEYLKKEAASFEDAWKDVKAYLLSELKMCGESIARMEKLLDYTCKGGKMTRAKTITRVTQLKMNQDAARETKWYDMFLSTPTKLEPKSDKKEDPLYAATILGWCLEITQAYLLVMDDIVDHSETRRFQPCWYKLEDVGVGLGIVDSVLLRSFVYRILKHFLGHKPYYLQVVEMFNHTMYMTEIGEMLDTLSEQKKDFKYLTLDTYMNVVWHKTCYYTIHLPIALGLVVSGDLEKTVTEEEVRQIAFIIGEYFQIQDDIMDCFSDPKTIGKIGTDIQDFKCSWLACQFMLHASPEQITEFKENYGKDEEGCIAKIKELYDAVGIKKRFEELEEEYGKKVDAWKPTMATKCPVLLEAVEMLWKVTYKRSY
jgi:farnesyl diphosphate synthase